MYRWRLWKTIPSQRNTHTHKTNEIEKSGLLFRHQREVIGSQIVLWIDSASALKRDAHLKQFFFFFFKFQPLHLILLFTDAFLFHLFCLDFYSFLICIYFYFKCISLKLGGGNHVWFRLVMLKCHSDERKIATTRISSKLTREEPK